MHGNLRIHLFTYNQPSIQTHYVVGIWTTLMTDDKNRGVQKEKKWKKRIHQLAYYLVECGRQTTKHWFGRDQKHRNKISLRVDDRSISGYLLEYSSVLFSRYREKVYTDLVSSRETTINNSKKQKDSDEKSEKAAVFENELAK